MPPPLPSEIPGVPTDPAGWRLNHNLSSAPAFTALLAVLGSPGSRATSGIIVPPRHLQRGRLRLSSPRQTRSGREAPPAEYCKDCRERLPQTGIVATLAERSLSLPDARASDSPGNIYGMKNSKVAITAAGKSAYWRTWQPTSPK